MTRGGPSASRTTSSRLPGRRSSIRLGTSCGSLEGRRARRERVGLARDGEGNGLARFVLEKMVGKWEIASADRRPMCADTGLPRYYVKLGNEAVVEGGLVALERALRRATAEATQAIPLRPNRVHPLTREDRNDNVGVHAPEVTYAVEPGADWIDVTTVHKGGLFGTDR